METVVTGKIPRCSDALAALGPEDIARLLSRIFSIDSIRYRDDGIEVVYVYRPDEFTRKRLRTAIRVASRSNDQVVFEARGALNADIVLRCRGDEAIAAVAVHGKAEKLITRQQLEEIAKRVIAALEEKAPRQREEAAPTATAAHQQLPAEAAAPQAPHGFTESLCIVEAITAGFPVDEELSRQVEVEYSPRLGTLPYVTGGVDFIERLDLVRYDDGYALRLVHEDTTVDVVRAGGRVGVYYQGPEGRAYGEDAVRLAAEKLCRPGTRVAYTVVRIGA